MGKYFKSNLYEIENIRDNALKITLNDNVNMTNIAHIYKDICKLIKSKNNINLIEVDLSHTSIVDDVVLSALFDLKTQCEKKKIQCSMVNIKESNKKQLELMDKAFRWSKEQTERKQKQNIVNKIGNYAIELYNKTNDQLIFLGDIILSLLYILVKPKHFRFNETITNIYRTGIEAIPIISLISFLMGLIMAFMSSIQLRQFGANIYVASLVGLAMARELAPIMTSIIVTGRSGSAFAAEIGTMKISEEIDALKVMGFDITKFLVIPRIIATIVATPSLTIISNICANIGGIIVGVGMLNLTFNAYTHQLYVTIKIGDFLHGIVKSAIFAFLIAAVGCYKGLCVQKGTEEVGKATTSAVVSGIFLIILVDSIIAVLLTYI